ncbi:MAG: aminodeoxychorismate lyase [Kangiellaceae bacterium]
MTIDIILKNKMNKSLKNQQQSLNRDALFGDGFFTTLVIENGNVLNESLHIQRLNESAKRLKFNHWNSDTLVTQLKSLAEANPNSIVRINCSRVQKERGYAFHSNSHTQCEFMIHPLIKKTSQACELRIAETPISVNSMLAGLKHINRLDNVLAASECQTAEQEVLMCHNDRVISGSRSNLFVKLDGGWFTPTISDCGIKGIMQNVVLKTMKELGVQCEFKNIYKNDLEKMSAAFVTNSILGIWPAKSFQKPSGNSISNLDLNCVMDLKKRLKL